MMFDTAPSATPHIKAGRLRAIAVTGDKRLPELPNVPTFAESGLKGFDATAWYGIMAPANTPKDVIANLNAAVNKVLADPGVRKRLQEMGAEPAGGTPEQLGDYLRQELAKWGKVIRDAKIKLD
jgi:tripartite-type tricarboxylate transporter receptor subunit TctC